MVCRRFLVAGTVQGVFYRASTARKAHELGVKGHAHNLDDGRVDVLACGEPAAVEALAEWLWQGSPGSAVSAVEERSCEGPPPQRFTTA